MSELSTPAAVAGAPAAAEAAVGARAAVRKPGSRPRIKEVWWRHVVGVIGVVVALFPVVYIVSSSFNAQNNLQSATVIPAHVTLNNFSDLLHNKIKGNTGAVQDAPYLHWFLNSVLIAGFTALFTTMLGALAAYAFSRFRFRGRRLGMLLLLLIQMFPQLIAVAAIYLIVHNIGGVFPQIGLDKQAAVVIVFLGVRWACRPG